MTVCDTYQLSGPFRIQNNINRFHVMIGYLICIRAGAVVIEFSYLATQVRMIAATVIDSIRRD